MSNETNELIVPHFTADQRGKRYVNLFYLPLSSYCVLPTSHENIICSIKEVSICEGGRSGVPFPWRIPWPMFAPSGLIHATVVWSNGGTTLLLPIHTVLIVSTCSNEYNCFTMRYLHPSLLRLSMSFPDWTLPSRCP
ncbi:hypothetical protein CC2G_013717 [Coprinopsis cinerea AmutBmut pab1-1]|nr:hypothetical protein CC2G_013717 [Coprinopsis cinerea AmutBmut pab1-1]